MQTYKKILDGKFDIPENFSSDLTDLVGKLLENSPIERYGCLKSGTKDIKNHIWISSIDWVAVSEKRLQAPFIPKDDEHYYEKYDEEPLTFSETDLYTTEFAEF